MQKIFTSIVYEPLSYQLCPLFFFNDTATTEIYTLSLHDALPIYNTRPSAKAPRAQAAPANALQKKAATVLPDLRSPISLRPAGVKRTKGSVHMARNWSRKIGRAHV